MTRKDRKNDEDKNVDLFLDELKRKKVNFIVNESIIDKPDLVININNKRVGCELTTLTLEDFEKWTRLNHELSRVQSIRLPNKPDKWLRNSLILKNKKIKSYKTLSKLDYMWLIIHVWMIPLLSNSDEIINILKWVSQETNHDFNQVWFIWEKWYVEKIWEIWQKTIDKPKELEYDIVNVRQNKIKINPWSNIIDLWDSEPEPNGSDELDFLRGAYFNDINNIVHYLNKGVDVNFIDNRGNTALRYAAWQWNDKIVDYLIKKWANINIKYKDPMLLVDICRFRWFDDIANLIVLSNLINN